MAKTLIETAREYRLTFSSPLFRDRKYARILRPLFGALISLAENPMPLRVRLSVLFHGVIPQSYLEELEKNDEETE